MKKLAVFLFGLLIATQSRAFLSQGYNIEQLSTKADLIFMGEVTQVTESPSAASIPYIEVHFNVFESLKGAVPASYTIKQFAPKVGKQYQMLGMGKNAYVVGQKLVMFMGAANASSGLSAPTDFQLFMIQTKSRRQADIDQALVMNKQFGEKIGEGLFQNLQKESTRRIMNRMPTQTKSKGVAFKDFRELVKASVKP